MVAPTGTLMANVVRSVLRTGGALLGQIVVSGQDRHDLVVPLVVIGAQGGVHEFFKRCALVVVQGPEIQPHPSRRRTGAAALLPRCAHATHPVLQELLREIRPVGGILEGVVLVQLRSLIVVQRVREGFCQGLDLGGILITGRCCLRLQILGGGRARRGGLSGGLHGIRSSARRRGQHSGKDQSGCPRPQSVAKRGLCGADRAAPGREVLVQVRGRGGDRVGVLFAIPHASRLAGLPMTKSSPGCVQHVNRTPGSLPWWHGGPRHSRSRSTHRTGTAGC